mgnify:CR=1 FL=1|tara:strand:- start:2378 stop:3409 length:1032 start_codon:yes stop_codon:yes gene_type:complete
MRIFSYIILGVSILLFSCTENVKQEEKKNDKVEVDSLTAYKNSEFEIINTQLKSDPNNPNLYIKRAQLYKRYNEVPFAIEDIDRAIKVDSLIPEFYLLKAEMQKEIDLYADAKRTLDKCLLIDNNNVQARIELGWMAFIIQNYEQAIEYADAALKRNMYAAEAYYLKGMVFYEKQDTARAISSFITAVEQESNYYEAYIQLGVLHFNQDNDLAKGYIKNALRIKPESPEALYHYGLWSQEHGDYNEAIETYHKIIAIKPYREALFNLGYIHQEHLKVYDLAIGFYTEAIGSDKNYFEAYYNRGLCHEFLGNYDQAELDFRKALEINPDYDYAALSIDRILKKK